MVDVVWHDERGENIITLADHPARVRETLECDLIRTTARMQATAEHVLTPQRLAELSDDARLVLEACERYGTCGD